MMIAKKCLIFPSYLICRWARLVSMTGQEQDDSSFELIKLSKLERGSPVFLGNLHIRDYFPAAASVVAAARGCIHTAAGCCLPKRWSAGRVAAVAGLASLKDRTSQVCEYICMYAMYRGAAGLTSKIVLRACWNIFQSYRACHVTYLLKVSSMDLFLFEELAGAGHPMCLNAVFIREEAMNYCRSPFKFLGYIF